jgi:hypothetical protein
VPTVFLVVVREDPGQAQAPVSNERRFCLLWGRVFTKLLTTRAEANLRVLALRIVLAQCKRGDDLALGLARRAI